MYKTLLLLHAGGVVLFVGIVLTSIVWQRAAGRSESRSVNAHTYHVLNRFDAFLTPISIAIIVITGVLLAKQANLPILHTGWILWSIVAWGVSGVLFLTIHLPLQKRLERDASDDTMWAESKDAYFRLARKWTAWAYIILLAVFVSFGLSVLKPQLPGL